MPKKETLLRKLYSKKFTTSFTTEVRRMTNNHMLEYKGYHAAIEYDADDMIFVATVVGIQDKISFHGESVSELSNKMALFIEEYLALCSEEGREPEKEYSGSFNVRPGPLRHKCLSQEAEAKGLSMNSMLNIILDERYALA